MCKECLKKPVYEMTNKRKFCAKCFCRFFEKKIFHTIRAYDMLRDAKKILIFCDGLKGNILFKLLKRTADKRGIKLREISNLHRKKDAIVVLSDNLNDGALSIITIIMGKNAKLMECYPKIEGKNKLLFIKPLYFCSNKEIMLYSRIKGIKIALEKREEKKFTKKIDNFIDYMELKHPEIRNAIVNAMLEIAPALKNK